MMLMRIMLGARPIRVAVLGFVNVRALANLEMSQMWRRNALMSAINGAFILVLRKLRRSKGPKSISINYIDWDNRDLKDLYRLFK